MDDLRYGSQDKRGNWRPTAQLNVAPVLVWPWSLTRFLKWLPAYFLPWNLMFFALGTASWLFLMPARDTMMPLRWGWAAEILARNAALVLLVFGPLELHLYVRRHQGDRFKYNAKFPPEQPSDVFFLRRQQIDNAIRTFATGVPVWSAYEVLLLWCWANHWGPWFVFGNHPVWFAAFALLVPAIHDLHFYCIHRLIHMPVLYRRVHSVHHTSLNPSPWSSLSMRPVEHLLYWSDSLIHLLLPSHPVLAIYHLQVNGLGAVVGHIGFDVIETDRGIKTRAQAHYLHRKTFEVNYSDGLLPLDRWFGTWHDGTEKGDRLMAERIRRKKARIKTREKSTLEQKQ